MAASWLQSRETARQTEELEAQLGAQVWPYVSESINLDDAGKTAALDIENDGLGPAVLYSLSATVDGKQQSNYIEVLHAILGTHLVKRKPAHEHMGLQVNNSSVGSVLRPGESLSLFRFSSKHFAMPFVYAYQRIQMSVCYCAIIAGKCWRNDANRDNPPKPVAACPVIPNDILHSSMLPTAGML